MKEYIIEGNWGYAVVKEDAIYIPVIDGEMSKILKELYERTKQKRMIFTAVLNPESFKKHLKNIKREWDHWWKEMEAFSHCIEIEYEPKGGEI